MKIIILALLLPLFASSQSDSLMMFSGVEEVPNLSKDKLYINARQWFVNSFKSAKDVLQVQDKETGELVSKGWFEAPVTIHMMGARDYMMQYYFKMAVYVKDGKYKYTITDIDNTGMTGNVNAAFGLLYTSVEPKTKNWPMYSNSKYREIYASVKASANTRITTLIADLKKSMLSKSQNEF